MPRVMTSRAGGAYLYKKVYHETDKTDDCCIGCRVILLLQQYQTHILLESERRRKQNLPQYHGMGHSYRKRQRTESRHGKPPGERPGRQGLHAISAARVFGANAYRKLSEKEIVDQFRNSGVDAVITIVLLDKQKEELYVPPAIGNNPSSSYDHVDKYYSATYDKVFSPGYYVSTTNYFWESNLFEVNQDKLVYSARTKSFDPASANMQAHENGLLLIRDMTKKKLLKDQVKKD